MPDDHVPVHSDKGKQILAHALSKEHCIIEFKERDDGTHVIMDITDHVEQLEKIIENATTE